MTVKLDSRWPLIWRDPFSAQFGVDPSIVQLDNITEAQERMLSALVVGVSLPGLAVICNGRIDERDSLLSRLEPVLLGAHDLAPAALVAVSGPGGLAARIAELLSASGARVMVADSVDDLETCTPDLAVVVGAFVLPPASHSVWLRRDVAHLPVVASDTGITIGPMIEPGSGPCLLCLELHRRDEDPAWPAMATQLLGRRGAVESALVSTEAAATVARLVWGRIGHGAGGSESVRIDAASGERTTRRWLPHPECGCRGISHLVALAPATARRPGTDSPGAARSAPARH